jgi:hypothetical protein
VGAAHRLPAKHNFISRTGQKSGRNVAEGIEKKLLASGYIATEGILPRSNLNRLLSSEDLRNAVGISFVDGKLYFTSPPEKALSALSRIAADLISKRLVLGHIWNNEGKRQYLAELKSHGALPAAEDVLTIPVAFEEATVPKRPTSPPVRYDLPSGPRATLIPNDIDYSVIWSARTTRLRDIWKELQQLSIERYPNAVAVSFRVFLELAVDNYIAVSAIVGVNESDGLRKKVDRVAAHLADRGTIAEKYKKELQKFASDEAIISTSAMHRYVHSLTYAPSPRHLTAIWDTLSEFLVRCVNENRDRQAA